jgi:hypothetical protein
MALHKIIEFYAWWFSICPDITSKFRNIAIFENLIKQRNNSKLVDMTMIFYCTEI